MNSALLWVAVALLGGCGSIARLVVDEVVTARVGGPGPHSAPGPTAFPLGIFVVNITGAFIAGLLAGATLTDDLSLLLLTAFVGGYTTFSTWMLDTLKLADARAFQLAAANVGVSLVVGFAAALAGRALGSAL